MIRVYEFSTWSNSVAAKAAGALAIDAAKADHGAKFTVAIGEWGVRTFLVLGAESKEAAKAAAVDSFRRSSPDKPCDHIQVRNVTNAKKYN